MRRATAPSRCSRPTTSSRRLPMYWPTPWLRAWFAPVGSGQDSGPRPRRSERGPSMVRRPKQFFDPEGPLPESASLELSVPRGFASAGAFRGELSAALATHEAAAVRSATGFAGILKVLAQKPTARPRDREPRRGLSPRIASRDPWRRLEALGRLRSFALRLPARPGGVARRPRRDLPGRDLPHARAPWSGVRRDWIGAQVEQGPHADLPMSRRRTADAPPCSGADKAASRWVAQGRTGADAFTRSRPRRSRISPNGPRRAPAVASPKRPRTVPDPRSGDGGRRRIR